MGSQTRTTTTAQPPQLMPEGAEGYGQASQFYKGQLGQPSVYQGQRYAPPTTLQTGAVQQGESTLGGPGEPTYSSLAKGETAKTLGGDWMTGQDAQNALTGMAQPLFERFENQTMPGIRDRGQFSTGGSGGSRRTVAEHNALQELGQSYASGVAAPIYTGERERMTKTALEGPGAYTAADLARTSGMMQLGEQERKLRELPLQSTRDAFEEALGRQAESAGSLASMAGMGPGGSSSTYNPSVMRMILGSGKA